MKKISGLSFVVILFLFSQSAFAVVSQCRQFYRDSLKEIHYVINTEELISFTERGGAPRQGISPVWSSRSVLSEVLSLRGVLGIFSAVSEMGPIGDNTWNPSTWWTKVFSAPAWKLAGKKIDPKNDPLGKDGVLSDISALAKDWGEGAYSILGTRGILGPLGPLGALSLMGALQTRGLEGPDANGNYSYKGRIVKSIDMKWADGSKHEFEIVEKYTSEEANRRSKNGSLENSYLVDASLSPLENSRSYRSKSDREKLVSVLVVPDIQPVISTWGLPMQNNLAIEVHDKNGNLIGKSSLTGHANFVQFAVPKDGEYVVSVRRMGHSWVPVGYRLISVGANAELFDVFPNILQANSQINVNAQFQDYLKRLEKRKIDIKIKR